MKYYREEIKKLLPHREPMLLVDEMECVDGMAVSSYHFRGDEFFFKGHFPGFPVVPGVILCEIMGQASVVLLNEDDYLVGKTPMYTGLDNVKFKHSVHPGDTFVIKSRIVNRRGPLFVLDAKGYVGETLCCLGRLSCMVVENENRK